MKNASVESRWSKMRIEFGKRLRDHRTREIIKISQKEFAIPLGINDTTLRKLEKGIYESADILKTIATNNKVSDSNNKFSDSKMRALKRALDLVTETIESVFIERETGLDGVEFVKVGNLELRFAILTGDLERSGFRPRSIKVEWLKEDWVPHKRVLPLLGYELIKFFQMAREREVLVRGHPLARLCGFFQDGRKIRMTLQPTNYSLFAVTNLNSDQQSQLWKSLSKVPLEERYSIPSPYLACPLNVIVMAISSDMEGVCEGDG